MRTETTRISDVYSSGGEEFEVSQGEITIAGSTGAVSFHGRMSQGFDSEMADLLGAGFAF